MQRLNFETIGLPKPGSGLEKSTGHSLSETGSSNSRAAVVAKLESQTPEETDRNLSQWLTSSLGIVPQPQVHLTYPTTGGYRREVTGYSFEGLTAANRSDALRAVQSAMTPATPERCEEYVSTLHAVTAHRQDSENSLRLILRLYSDCLARFPADVAKAVVDRFIYRPDKPNFFPTLSELNEACERQSDQREKLLASLTSNAVSNISR